MNHVPLPAGFRRSLLAAAASTLFLLPAWSGQAAEPGPVGGEFQVNTLTTSTQTNPAVAIDADGDFVVAWQSFIAGSNEIRAQRYNAAGVAQGGEIPVNTLITSVQSNPAVAVDADGDFVVSWQSDAGAYYGIRAQRYNAAGVAQGGEITVNTVTTVGTRNADVAIDADGDFVVTWQVFLAGSYDIHAQRFNAAGLPQGGEITVNTLTTNDQFNPVVAIDADGDFVIVWDSEVAIGDYDVRAKRYNALGQAVGGEVSVNTVTTGKQFFPGVALDADGDFVIAWQSLFGGSYEIRAQRYNAAGQTLGGEFTVNTLTSSTQSQPVVALDAGGDFVVAWQGLVSGGDDIRAQRYDAAGQALGDEFAVNVLLPNPQRLPSIALDADGDFVVAWASNVSSSYEIRARRFQGSDSVDLSLFQTDSADPAPVGSPLSYSLNVGNLQAPVETTGIPAIDTAIGVATGLRVVDLLPANSTGVSASGSNWSCAFPAGRVVCDYALVLAAAEEASPITVSLTPPATPGELISNVARVSAHPFDGDALNNRDVERTRLVCADSMIQFSAATFSVGENGGNATVTATRTGGSCGAVSVQFDTAGSTALPGLDFTDVTGTLSWANGDSTSKSFTVPVNSDALDEIDERFIASLGAPSGASLGTQRTARVVITDDDAPPRVNFTARSQNVREVDGPLVSVTVRLGAESGRDVSVPLTFGGTADNGADYFPAATSLNIRAGQTQVSADLEIVNDTSDEPDETVIVGMGTVVGATQGSVNTHTVTLLDDDEPQPITVSFTTVSSSGDETLTRTAAIQLSEASAQSVTVPFTVSGSATPGGDYSLSRSSPITFNPGVTQIGIQSMPVDDALDEPNETVILTLGTPTNATLGTTTVHTRTIVDNDPP